MDFKWKVIKFFTDIDDVPVVAESRQLLNSFFSIIVNKICASLEMSLERLLFIQ